jgi:CDP-diacylglycerol--glycerol-3-phosphate 3-phosphatidyltransferase
VPAGRARRDLPTTQAPARRVVGSHGCAYSWPVAVAPTVSGPRAQLPNGLTVARLLAIPACAALLLRSEHGYSWYAAIVFGLAGVTDQIDGFLARRWHVESAFGQIADPLADRLLIDVAVLLLWHAGRLPWAALIIPARDVFVMGATPFLVGRGYRFEVNTLGKLATWLLYLSIGLVMVVHHADWPLPVFWAGLALALVSLLLYARKARRETGAEPREGSGGDGGAQGSGAAGSDPAPLPAGTED